MSYGKGQEPYNFPHLWDINKKATKKQAKQKTKLTDKENRMVIPRGTGS